MDKRFSFISVLVVMATFITLSCAVAAGGAGQGKAPPNNWENSADVSQAAGRTWDQGVEFYGVGVTPSVYFVNFLLMYMANPNNAAYMPAYRTPMPRALSDCLLKNPTGCSYFEYANTFDNTTRGKKVDDWPRVCQTDPEYAQLAPDIARRPDQINEPLGMDRANRLAEQLNMDKSMILTDDEYQCTIGTAPRVYPQDIIFACINNLSNSNGNTNIPLSSYGLTIATEDQSPNPPLGVIQSLCAPEAPCLVFNELFAGDLEALAKQCGWLEKLLLMWEKTEFFRFAAAGALCQELAGSQRGGACIVPPVGR